MPWQNPPIIKIYEALGAIADDRIEISGNSAKVYSSSRNKFYTVNYSPEENAIMANDNGSYWKGYLGYPTTAFLLKIGVLDLDIKLANLLKGIKWKDINTKFKNDFDKTLEYIFSTLKPEEVSALEQYANKLAQDIAKLNLKMFGKRTKPPAGY